VFFFFFFNIIFFFPHFNYKKKKIYFLNKKLIKTFFYPKLITNKHDNIQQVFNHKTLNAMLKLVH